MTHMIGADLGSLTSLSTQFESFGNESRTFVSGVVAELDRARTDFQQAISTLAQTAATNRTNINSFVRAASDRFAGTAWTGSNRQKVEALQASWQTDIAERMAKVDAYIGECQTLVNGPLSTDLTTMTTACGQYSNTAAAAASSFAAGVTSQRNAINLAMNG